MIKRIILASCHIFFRKTEGNEKVGLAVRRGNA